MNYKLKRWEVSLMVGLAAALVFGAWVKQEQSDLSERVIRLHVIANSDSREDQELKLAVRDRILDCAEELYPQNAGLEQADAALADHLAELSAAGEAVVQERGSSYPVTAELERCWFPTKEYEDFAMPAGNYRALRVVIGEGKGRNWWCVAFPPLCLGAASETLEQAVEAGHFTRDQARLLKEDGGIYVFRFRTLELLGRLQRLFSE